MAKASQKTPEPAAEAEDCGAAVGHQAVGYGKPPKHSRFQPGQSGNPKGRPKTSRNAKTIIKSALDTQVVLRRDGKASTVTAKEAVMLKLVEKALTGDHRSMDKVLDLMQVHDEDEGAVRGPLGADDSAILLRFIKQATEAPDNPDATGAGDRS